MKNKITNKKDSNTLGLLAIDWLDNYANDYLPVFNGLSSDVNISTAIATAKKEYPKLAEYLKQYENPTFKIDQIMGYGDKMVSPNYVDKVRGWLNANSDKIQGSVGHLDNLPGVIDIDKTKPYEIADLFPSIKEDNLKIILGFDHFFQKWYKDELILTISDKPILKKIFIEDDDSDATS